MKWFITHILSKVMEGVLCSLVSHLVPNTDETLAQIDRKTGVETVPLHVEAWRAEQLLFLSNLSTDNYDHVLLLLR